MVMLWRSALIGFTSYVWSTSNTMCHPVFLHYPTTEIPSYYYPSFSSEDSQLNLWDVGGQTRRTEKKSVHTSLKKSRMPPKTLRRAEKVTPRRRTLRHGFVMMSEVGYSLLIDSSV
ncbi:hypothetical protein L3Y34_017339 [Caenorhabditis briggsae]|uniref:Secreted protein n=1 Tax=Caenorhabditis briggsae TaxID=6238 RepID=A0AAE9DH67_CAEBR|nr:hypothetical protein L3Y34_017339 [Caenorhabditis briggsae]